jgi:NADPH-dependent F420 reductase
MVAQEINQQLRVGFIGAAENQEMIGASELIFLTVPFQQARAALDAYRDSFRHGSILVDATVPLTFGGGPVQIVRLVEGSGSQSLAKLLPEGIPLVATFKTIPAHVLADLNAPLDCDAFVCSDSEPAKAKVMEAIRLIPGLRPVDAGGLEAAATLERMSRLAIEINRKYKIKTARFRIVGLWGRRQAFGNS